MRLANGGSSQSVSQLFHGPAPRSPLHRLAVRLHHSRSNTSTKYSLPGATQLSQVRSNLSPAGTTHRVGSLPLFERRVRLLCPSCECAEKTLIDNAHLSAPLWGHTIIRITFDIHRGIFRVQSRVFFDPLSVCGCVRTSANISACAPHLTFAVRFREGACTCNLGE